MKLYQDGDDFALFGYSMGSIVVSEVVKGSSAEKAGIDQYDVIVEMNGQKIENSIDLRQYLYNETDIGDTLKIKVYRQGQMKEIQLTLTEGTNI